jgi:hypothetical protein
MFAILSDGAVASLHNNSRSVAIALGKRDNLSYQANICQVWSKEELKEHNVVRFEEPSVPIGKLEEGDKSDTIGEFIVTRKATWVDDPDYVAPTPVSQLQLYKDNAVAIIKLEAHKRIIAAVPEWKQRNVIADLSSDDADTKAAAATEWKRLLILEPSQMNWKHLQTVWIWMLLITKT